MHRRLRTHRRGRNSPILTTRGDFPNGPIKAGRWDARVLTVPRLIMAYPGPGRGERASPRAHLVYEFGESFIPRSLFFAVNAAAVDAAAAIISPVRARGDARSPN